MEKIFLTGIKPTGNIHLGNLYGAILPTLNEINKSDILSYVFVADVHALNSLKNTDSIKENIYSLVASLLAFGLDPLKTVLYKQSDIPEIFELSSILMNYTSKGLMNRAHAYKFIIEKDGNDNSVNMGLFVYPVLMAADILAIGADTVPVGQDQKQHIEITRDIATSFNYTYKTDILKLPDAFIAHTDAILGLDGRKMSKSYNNTIEVFSDPVETLKKIMKIPTDDLQINDPKNKNCLLYKLMSIFKIDSSYLFKFITGGVGYGDAKKILAETINSYLAPYRLKYNELIRDKNKLDLVLKEGKEKARDRASKTLYNVKKITGLI